MLIGDEITEEELEQLYEIDADIRQNGLPAEDELRAVIEELNRTARIRENGATNYRPLMLILPVTGL